MRRFHFIREKDASGVSGVGKVAEGVIFSNGKVATGLCNTFHFSPVIFSKLLFQQLPKHNLKSYCLKILLTMYFFSELEKKSST